MSGSFRVEPLTFVAYLTRASRDVHDAERCRAMPAICISRVVARSGSRRPCGCSKPARAEIPVALGRMQLQPSAVDEVCQMTREKLLVGGPAGAAHRGVHRARDAAQLDARGDHSHRAEQTARSETRGARSRRPCSISEPSIPVSRAVVSAGPVRCRARIVHSNARCGR